MDEASYPTVGIFSYGKGLFRRPIVRGHETSYKAYHRIHAKQFVYSRLFAWEGALAVVLPEFDELFVSPEFPTFDIDEEKALPEFVQLMCEWPTLWERLRSGESGLGGRRKRVHPDHLLSVEVPLPSLADQKRIVDLFSVLRFFIHASEKTVEATRQVRASLLSKVFSADVSQERGLIELADVIMGQSPPGDSYNTDGDGLPFLQGSADFGLLHPNPRVWCSAPKKIAERGDILLSVRAPVGSLNVANESVAIGRGLSIIRAHDRSVQRLLRYAIEHAVPELLARSGGSTFASATKEGLLSLPVIMPKTDADAVAKLLLSVDSYLFRLAEATTYAQHSYAAFLSRYLDEGGTIPGKYDLVMGPV